MIKNKATITSKLSILILLVMVATLSLGVYVYKGVEVSLNLDGEDVKIVSYSETVREFIQKEDIKFKWGAYINVPLDARLEDNPNIIIKNLKTYSINDNGSIKKIRSVQDTVEEILKDKKIELGEKDYTYPKLDNKILENDTIKLFRFREETIIEETVLTHQSIVTKTRDLDVGTSKIVQEGKDGLKETHTHNIYVNDELIVSKVVKDEIIEEVKDHIVEKGIRDSINTSRGDTRYKKSITMNATAYDLSFQSTGKRPGDRYYGMTASGTMAAPGCVAVDPRVIPLGTKLYIQSLDGSKDYGFASAQDTGSAIKGNKIDLFYESHSVAMGFGRKNVKVYILE